MLLSSLFPGIAGQKLQTRKDVLVGCSAAVPPSAGAPQVVSYLALLRPEGRSKGPCVPLSATRR